MMSISCIWFNPLFLGLRFCPLTLLPAPSILSILWSCGISSRWYGVTFGSLLRHRRTRMFGRAFSCMCVCVLYLQHILYREHTCMCACVFLCVFVYLSLSLCVCVCVCAWRVAGGGGGCVCSVSYTDVACHPND